MAALCSRGTAGWPRWHPSPPGWHCPGRQREPLHRRHLELRGPQGERGHGIITTLAGNGNQGPSCDGGPATSASFALPLRVAADGAGNVYILDAPSAALRASGGSPPTHHHHGRWRRHQRWHQRFADGGQLGAARTSPWTVPGTATSREPARLKADLAANTISSIAGTGLLGFSGDGGDATLAMFNGLGGVAVGIDGALYVSDTGNLRVRKVAPSAPRLPRLRRPRSSPPWAGRWSFRQPQPLFGERRVHYRGGQRGHRDRQRGNDLIVTGNSAAAALRIGAGTTGPAISPSRRPARPSITRPSPWAATWT